MTAAQHRLFEMLVQSASESRAQMHDTAWILLGALLLTGILALCGIFLWVTNGGFVAWYALHSVPNRKTTYRDTAESEW